MVISIVMADPQNGRFRMENPIKMDEIAVPPISGNLHKPTYFTNLKYGHLRDDSPH